MVAKFQDHNKTELNNDGDGNQNGNKRDGFFYISKTTTLHV